MHWSDLRGETLLIHDLPDEEQMALTPIARESSTKAHGKLRKVHLTEAIAEMARARHGVGVLSRWVGPAPFNQHGLSVRTLRSRVQRTIWAVWLRTNPRDLPIDAFTRFLAAESVALQAGS
jgi:LysR family transcriptional regulator, regulator for metE and metH